MGEAFTPDDSSTLLSSITPDVAGSMSAEEVMHLYQREYQARVTAERRLDAEIQDARKARQTAALHNYVMASAHCLLWYADIYETNSQYLDWIMEFPNMDAARGFLPLEIKDGETVTDAWYNRRHIEDRDACDVLGTTAIRSGQSYQQEFRCFCDDGSFRWLHEDVHVETIVEGRHWRAVGVCTDITSHHQLQARMHAANRRLKRSITETHHRVKNNLQAAASLLDMQHAEEGQPVEMQTAFQRIGQHIRGLAAIHEVLTFEAPLSTEHDTVSLRAVMDRLVGLVRETLGRREIHETIANIRLPSRQVSALVVLTNELVSNAVKHSRGDIELVVEIQSGFVRLSICDEGPGFPVGFDPSCAAHTGLEIVESIGRWDLQGTITYETRSGGGGRVTVEFLPGAPDMA